MSAATFIYGAYTRRDIYRRADGLRRTRRHADRFYRIVPISSPQQWPYSVATPTRISTFATATVANGCERMHEPHDDASA